jgi:hypothetical protein
MIVGLVNSQFIHHPIAKAVEKKKVVDCQDSKFQAVRSIPAY